ncbi:MULTISPECIES: hypothetical protein [unclassified Streptomyces]|uniref:hypothetical protein n=1 Tax=unclassified Streptomyces TaxID=2593676 RepID=UPI001BE616D0|nr:MULTISPECIES: hypothetical protein [unclassified Streptomyces]MBT2404710.1 hypothetical protein [Streptomyces sp. ISL-21]MBT2458850.1 hypothetical protein [Streptomyces sp. ISL-86]
MEFVVGGMAITTVGSDGDDRAIEFRVTSEDAAEPGHFAIHRDHDKGWEAARLTVDPDSGSLPVAAVEWAVEFAREYL